MKNIFFPLIFCFPLIVFSQCKDSLCQPTTYCHCGPDYTPVCACDGKTYRNACVAEACACILPSGHTNGICDDFDIDLYPNLISADPNTVPELRIYMKFPGTATITIYNSMGGLVFEKLFTTNLSFSIIPAADPYYLQEAQTFLRDVYLIVITVNGNKKTLKFIKVDNGK